jgi:hypothetical protein
MRAVEFPRVGQIEIPDVPGPAYGATLRESDR